MFDCNIYLKLMLLFADYSTTWSVYMYLAISSSSLKPSSGQPLKYKNTRNILFQNKSGLVVKRKNGYWDIF